MKIAIAGASGQAGSRITAELARRGHAVTAIARNPEKIADLPGVTAKKGDVNDEAALAALWVGHDAAISSVHFSVSDPAKLIGAAKASGTGRYLVVGGAGSLEVAPGVRLVTTPTFPAQYKAEASKGAEFLDLLRREKDLNWTFALGPVRGGRADRQVPPRRRPAPDRRGRKKLDLVRGFRSCTRRRNRASGPYPQAFHGRLLRARERAQGVPQAGRISLPVQGLGGSPPFMVADIVCHMSWLYKAPRGGVLFPPPDRDMAAFGKAEELPAD